MNRRKFFGMSATGTAGLVTGTLMSQPVLAQSSSGFSSIAATTLLDAINDPNVVVGDVFVFSDRADGIFDVVDGATGANGFNIVAHNNLSLNFVLRTDNVINAKQFGARGDEVTDDSDSLNQAITMAEGREVFVPEGKYLVTNTLGSGIEPTMGAFGPGLKIIGAGALNTIFLNRVADGAMITIDGPDRDLNCPNPPQCEGKYMAAWGSVLREFTIEGDTSGTTNSIGISISNGYEIIIEHLYIKNMSAHGIELKNGVYRDDGWNMVSIKSCWIEACKGWGIKADGTSARNEGSYTYLENVFFQTNGTREDTLPPTSGGMIWKGQILTMEQSGFANGNENVGLFVKGDIGLGQTVDLRNTTFENCHRRSLYCTGILMFKGRNLQFYNNDDFTAVSMCEFDGGNQYSIRNIDIDGVSVRAAIGNKKLTAFRLAGDHAEFANCSVKNVNWENFYSDPSAFGSTPSDVQIRFDGFKDKPNALATISDAHAIYPSTTFLQFKHVVNDAQGIMEPGSGSPSTGRFRVYYKTVYTIKGRIKLLALPVNTQVQFQLLNTTTNQVEQEVVYKSSGVASETFYFDFSGEYGVNFATRVYEIRGIHDAITIGSRQLDVSNPQNNALLIERVVTQS